MSSLDAQRENHVPVRSAEQAAVELSAAALGRQPLHRANGASSDADVPPWSTCHAAGPATYVLTDAARSGEGGADEAKGDEAVRETPVPEAPTASVADLAQRAYALLNMWGDDEYDPLEFDPPALARAADPEGAPLLWEREYLMCNAAGESTGTAVRTFQAVKVEQRAEAGSAPMWCLACTGTTRAPTSAQLLLCRQFLWDVVQKAREDEEAAARERPSAFYLCARAHRGNGPLNAGAASAAWFRLVMCVDTTVDDVVAVVFDQPCSMASDHSEQFVYLNVKSGDMDLGSFEPGIHEMPGAPMELRAPGPRASRSS